MTQLRCGGTFNSHFIANCPENVPVKHFENWLIFREYVEITKCDVFGTQCNTLCHTLVGLGYET